jgi:hypothetical protein
MITEEMRQAMNTLRQFSEKERDYHAYQVKHVKISFVNKVSFKKNYKWLGCVNNKSLPKEMGLKQKLNILKPSYQHKKLKISTTWIIKWIN